MSDVPEWDEEADAPIVTGAPGKLAQTLPRRTPAAGEAAPEPADVDEPPAAEEPQLVFGSVDEFVREKLRWIYVRDVGPTGSFRWAAAWWRYPEAISRLDSIWRAWEALRLEPTFGISVWWRDHADPHMRVLMDPEGPFKKSPDRSDGEKLPYEAPPAGMFVDVRTLGL